MAKQSFSTGQVLTAAQVNSLQSNDFNQTVSVKTAAYTLVAADKGTRIEFNTSGSVTCTVNTGLFDAGDTLVIQNRGAGVVTVTAGTATVNTSATLALSQYDAGTLYFISASAAIFFNTDAGGGSPLTTKGDLYTFSSVDTRLGIGANNTVLTADSAEATGMKWAAAAGGGKVLQVVSAAITTATTITTDTMVDTGITANITPTASTSKILVLINAVTSTSRSNTDSIAGAQLMRGATIIANYFPSSAPRFVGVEATGATFVGLVSSSAIIFLDSPATTSSTTYKVQALTSKTSNSGQIVFQPNTAPSTITLLEIGA